MKLIVFWDVTSCSLVETDLSFTGRTASIIKAHHNIKMDLWEIGFGDVDWILWAQDRDRWRALVNTVMNLRLP
jgi:hypothetical protein